ncbi:MAG: hypothetical protein AAGI22_03350 [Planctomycetota bacterium]
MTLSLLVATLIAPTGAPDAGSAVALTPKAYRTWGIELPADPFRKLSGAFPIPHQNGDGFAIEARGVGFAVDVDGDGELDRVIEGRVHPETKVRHARVVLTGERADGSELRYPVRLKDEGKGWHWAAGGALVGSIDGTQVRLVDMDGNGSHGDVGTDAIVVGATDAAQFLGETIAIDGTLRTVHVQDRSLSVDAFDGATGLLDVRSKFGGKGVLLSAVVSSTDGRQSFELSGHEKGLRVPTGEYELVGATLGLGDARVTVDASEMAAVSVAADGATAMQWGAPIQASFAYKRADGKIVLDPNDVRYVGAGGEKWIGWSPIGKSPTFQIKEKDTGDVLVDVVFPGSC